MQRKRHLNVCSTSHRDGEAHIYPSALIRTTSCLLHQLDVVLGCTDDLHCERPLWPIELGDANLLQVDLTGTKTKKVRQNNLLEYEHTGCWARYEKTRFVHIGLFETIRSGGQVGLMRLCARRSRSIWAFQ